MRRIYSIFLISFFAVASMFAKDASVTVEVLGDSNQNTEVQSAGVLDGKSNELQRKSSYALGTAPLPFTEVNNSHYNIAVSTGYYLVDNFDQDAADYWRPSETIYSRSEDPDLWFNIIAGPRIVDSNYWRDNTEEGKRFFRNPAYPTNGNSYFEFNNLDQDTVDNAFAGPMPLKVNGGFYFNGIRYDSFYVTTNGLIALTNRRYFYDEFGNKYIPPGETTAYDPNSMDRFVTFVNGEDRRRVGDGLADNTPDDFGFKYSVLGGNPENPTSGIRSTLGYRQSTALHNITSRNYKPALIGFMHGNNRLSQFSSTTQRVDNHGRVSYRRTINNDRVIIYFENLVPSGSKFYPNVRINYPTPNDMRPGDNGYTAVSGQTILNRNDSSITIVYERFMGGVRNGNQLIPARDIFRANNTAGVYGFGRHANYNVTGGPDENDDEFPWVSEYEQYTYYFSDFTAPANFPATFSSVKFKQHQNTLRVVDIQYRVRKQDPNANLDFSEEVKSQDVNNYELLAGNDHLGAIQPVAIIQNVSNDLQSPTGVNFVPQDLNFYARFRVQNQATGRIVYNRAVPVDHRCLATPDSSLQDCEGNPDVRVRLVNVTIDDKGNYVAEVANYPGTNSWNGKVRDGLPPYGYVQVKFPPFEPNEFAKDENNKLYQIGRMAAYVIADATNPNNGKKLGDRWPFDDTAGVNLHVMKLHRFFSDDVREFHVIGNATIPSVQKWVSIDAEVINGDANSRHPLAPRGRYAADNNENLVLSSPVIKMNRKSITGQDNSPGDELRSHPIDMRGRYGSVISLSVQRTLDKEFWDRGYGDGLLVGPEPRSILNFDPFNNYRGAGSVAANPDMLKVEIMLPSDDGVSNITNVKDNRWSNHPRRGGLDPETKVPALGIYGAGGYVIGFLESDPDSSLAEPNAGTREMNSLRSDIYDDGIDFVYKKYFVPIPDTFIRWQNAGAKHFRFRIKMDASDDKKCGPCIPDDDDNFLVDNINVLFDTGETTDIEISAITFDWPYTEAPATQASSIPIEVTATNNTKNNAPFYYILVKIFRGTDTDTTGSLVYCRTLPITSHEGNDEIVRNPPNFPARDFGEGLYRAQAIIVVEGGDLEELNDTTYTDFEIKFGPTFAYDPVDSPVNNISGGTFPEGRGLNLRGYAYGGTTAGARSYNEAEHGAGYIGGSISGQVAMKFELLQKDTIYGYDAFFGTINQAPDAIALSIYNGDKDINIPQGVISESIIDRQRGRDDRDGKLKYGEYVRYILPKNQRQILEPGVYWMSIAQLGETGLELAGSSQRAGLRTLNVYIPPAQPIVGESGISLNIHKEFRKRNRNGNLVNNSYFALENTRGSGNWSAFTPGIGNVGYAHLHHFGGGVDAATSTLTNGTWIPMIRPYLGNKSSGSKSNELIDDCDVPIELVDFKGDQRKKAIDLDWITATEENNKGFYIEKRMKLDQGNTEWEQISFVNGNGNTKSTSYYDYSDENVVPGTTYQYQLRQVDFDGTQTCFDSKIVEINFTGAVTLTNYPNPVKDQTSFKYSLEKNSKVTLEIIDLLGNVVNTVLSNVEQSAGIQTEPYDVTDAIGNKLRTGTYIYKLTVDGKSQSAKMNVVK